MADLTQFLTSDEEGPKKALEMAYHNGQVDGEHHMAWTIDKMVRALTGENYDRFIEFYRFTPEEYDDGSVASVVPVLDDSDEEDDREELYSWDEGIAP